MRFVRKETATETETETGAETDRSSRWRPSDDHPELDAAPALGAQVRLLVVVQASDFVRNVIT